MTREAKIGMLTGLGVILLIGVLLSDYLGGGKGPSPSARMASLPIGADYREGVMQPVVPPGMSPARSAESATYAMNETVSADAVPPAFARTATAGDSSVTEPTVGRAVTAVSMGPAPAGVSSPGGPPTFAISDSHGTVVSTAVAANPDATSKGGNTTHVIAAGDTLIKIARKYYGPEAKQSDVARLVAANPTILKDATATLIIGKKLMIANPPSVTVASSSKPVQPTVAPKTESSVVVYLPGSPDAKVHSAAKAVTPKKEVASKTYVVQTGDTLEKIARRFAPSNSSQLVAKLKATNGIKDPTALQVGMTLKIPV